MLDFHSEPYTNTDTNTVPYMAQPRYFLRHAVRRGIEYIDANLSEDVRLEDIAEAASLSRCHFARLFKKTTGMTPHRYLMYARVGKVKALLGQSDLGLAAIADESGFADQGHMSKVFKRLTGMTPKRFRNERRIETADRYFNSIRCCD